MQRIIKSIQFRKIRTTTVLAIAAAALVTGCQDLRDSFSLKPLNGMVARVSLTPAATQVNGAVVDAKTGNALGDIRVTVKITGPDADRVVDSQGNKLPESFVTKGSIGLYLTGEVPTLEKPASVLVTVIPPDGLGYLSSSTNLVLTKALNDPFEVKLINKNSPPEGVSFSSANFTVGANGVIPALKSIQLNGAFIAIKAGLQFLSNGTPLANGAKVDIAIRRGGAPLGSTVSIKEGDKFVDAVLNLYEFYTFDLTSNGQPVTIVGDGVSFLIPVANPADIIDLVRYDNITGQFSVASQTAPQNVNGGTYVPISVLDFSKSFGIGQVQKNTCTGALQINVVDGSAQPIEGFGFGYEVVQDGLTFKGSTSSSIDFPAAVAKPATIRLLDNSGEVFQTLTLESLCGLKTQTVSYNKPTVNVGFSANVTCANGKTPKLNGSDLTVALYPTVSVWYGEKGKNLTSSAIISGGSGTLVGLKPNTTYKARVEFEGSYEYEFTTGSSNSTLDPIQVNIKSGTVVCP